MDLIMGNLCPARIVVDATVSLAADDHWYRIASFVETVLNTRKSETQ